ncbi:MAG: zinc-binding dehydrogenase [Leptospirales bacterium]|nr:zinc-binding dehydrogenase [Leptospirales bacterium]
MQEDLRLTGAGEDLVFAMRRQIWLCPQAGSLDRLKLQEDELAPPGPGEAQIELRSAGLNFADIFALQGLYSATPQGPFTPGLEFSGVVRAVGRGAGPLKKGAAVMGVTRFGGYATHLNIDVRYLRLLPRGWSFAQGAALLAQGFTAAYALLDLGNCQKGQVVLVHSAAGGVGLIALDLAARLGARCIATIGSASKVELLQKRAGLASHQIIIRDAKNFGRQLDGALQSMNAAGLDLALDSLGGEYFRPLYDRLNAGGRHTLFGWATMMGRGARPNYAAVAWRYLRRPRLDPIEMISANKSLLAFNLIWMWERIDQFQNLYSKLMALKPQAPYVGRSFPFAAAPQALRYFQSGQSSGKITLEMPG